MEILKNPSIQKQLNTNSQNCNFQTNFQRLNIILNQKNNSIQNLKELFQSIINGETNHFNYYQMQNLFKCAEINNPTIVVELFIDIITETIRNLRATENTITLALYIKIWKSYKTCVQKICPLIKNYQSHLMERNINAGSLQTNIISIIEVCSFHDIIVSELYQNNNLQELFDPNNMVINKENIDQLITCIDSLRTFIAMKNFTKVDEEKISSVIKNIVRHGDVMNSMCNLMDDFFKSLESDNEEKRTIRKIYNITIILSIYADAELFYNCYRKTMQARIIVPKYKNLDLEASLVRKICNFLDKSNGANDGVNNNVTVNNNFSASGLVSINDNTGVRNRYRTRAGIPRVISGPRRGQFSNTNNSANNINNATSATIINNSTNNSTNNSAKNSINYKFNIKKLLNAINDIKNSAKIHETDISHPIVLTKNAWDLEKINSMDLIYPTELMHYLELANKAYFDFYKGEYSIDWQPTMGVAQFVMQLEKKTVEIKCNILQAIALMYLNDHPKTTAVMFAEEVKINLELAKKIFESLFKENILIRPNRGDNIYMGNANSFHNDERKIDIRQAFLDTLEENGTIINGQD